MDWKSYIQADLSNLADDEQKVEQIYNFLQENNLPRDVDSVDFRAIFKNTMTVMRFYASRTNAYFEELVKRERDEPRSEEDKEELIHLREELKEKENTIRDLRAAGSGHAMSEVRELREENSDLRRTVDRMKRQAETARDDIQNLSDDLQQARGKVRELERERDTLLQDISDYKRQIQWQSHNSTSGANTGGTGYYRDLLRDKDRKLDKTLDEVERLVTANASMEGELGSLTVKLQQVEQGRAELANQMSALRTALKESDLKCDDYESKTKMMNDRIEDLTGNLKKARKSDEEIAAILDRQQKEWEVNDKRKEEELNRLRKKVSQLEQQLRMVGADKDKKTVSKLTKTIKEREEELRDLGEQLDRAVKHIEALTAELELSKNKRDMIAGGEGGSNGSKQLTVKVLQLEEMLKHEREQRIQVEREKASVEEEMLRLSRRVRDYETGDFGLSEAVEEIKKRKVEVSVRDEQLRKRTEEVNSLNNDLDTVCEENEVLRRRLGLSNEEEIDIKDIKHRKNVEIERLRAVNRELEKQVSRLEEDRVDLRQQLLLEAKKRAERSVELGLTTDSLVSVEDYAERLRASSRQRSPELQRDQNNSSLAKELTSAKKSLEKYKNECKRLRAELKESSSLNDERLTALQNMTSQITHLGKENDELKQRLADHGTQQQSQESRPVPVVSDRSPQDKDIGKLKLEWNQELERVLLYLKSGTVQPLLSVKHVPETTRREVKELGENWRQTRDQQKRRMEILQNELEILQKRVKSLQNDVMGAEKANHETVTQLQQDKMSSQRQIEELEGDLARRVPKDEMQTIEAQLSESAAKNREALSQLHLMMERVRTLETVAGSNETTSALMSRNKVLEERCSELTQTHLKMQTTEAQLRQEVADSFSPRSKEQLEKKLELVENSKRDLSLQLTRMTDLEEAAQQQCLALATIVQSQEQEVNTLKKQLEDYQTQSDDRATIAKLNQQLVALQTSEVAALQKAESQRLRASSLQGSLLKAERQTEASKREVFTVRRDMNRQLDQLQSTVRSLQRKCSSCVPLDEHHKVVAMLSTFRSGNDSTTKPISKNGNEIRTGFSRPPNLSTSGQSTASDEMQQTLARMSALQEQNTQQQRLISKLQSELELSQKRQPSPLPSLTSTSAPKTSDREAAQMRTELALARKDNAHLEKMLQETKTLLVKRETEMAEMRIHPTQVHSAQMHSTQVISRASRPPSQGVLVTSSRSDDSSLLAVAQQTIEDMKGILSQKETMVEKYQNLLQEARREAQQMVEKHKNELMQLTQKLHKEKEDAFRRFKQASLDSLHNVPKETPQDRLSAEILELKETLLLKDHQYVALSAKLKSTREDHQLTCQKYQDHIQRLRDEMQHLDSEQELKSQQFEKVIKDKAKKITDLELEVEVLDGEVRAAREASRKTPARATRDLVEKLKADLNNKDRQYKALSEALVEVRAELIEVTQRTVQHQKKRRADKGELDEVVQEKTAELQAEVDRFKTQLSCLEEEAREGRAARERNLLLVEKLQEKIVQRDELVARLESEISSRQKIIDQVKSREKRANEEIESLQHRLEANQEAETLQKRVKVLQGRLEKERQRVNELENALRQAKQATAAHSHTPKPEHPTVNNKHSTEEVIRWEESKKWQKKVESLKNKLTEKIREIEDHQKQIKSLKDTVERTERDRGLLQSKLRAAQRTQNTSSQPVPSAHVGTVVREQPQPRGGGVGSAVPQSVLQLHADQVHQLKSKIAELENELTPLQLKLSTMEDESNEAEKRLLEELNSSVDVVKRQCVGVDAGLLAGRVEELQSELLACQKQSMRLKFELEQAVVTQPRMKARIIDLEDYNTVLKSSLAEAEKNTTAGRPVHSGVRDPTSKSTSELERVISAMKKVIEKLRSENEDLKRRPVRPARKEDKGGSERLSLMEEEMMKAFNDNEELRANLIQERERVCQLQSKVSRLEASLKKHKEQDEETRKDVLSHQETIASLQTDLDKKSEMLQEVKHHLQLAAKREEELSRHHATQEEVQLLSREREQLRQENRKLREELASFDQSFFDEIEEIKFNYHESLNKIKHYQEQLKVLSAQHNFPSPNL